jgi:Bacterial Ig-like domain (group 2)
MFLYKGPALSLLILALVLGTGCGTGLNRNPSADSPSPSPRTVASIAVTPSTVSLTVNGTQQLTANANYSDRSAADVTTSATWTSSNAAVASVSSSGTVTAVSPGTATITASDGDQSSAVAVTVAAPKPQLTSIAVTPQGISLSVGNTQQLHATATYSDSSTSDVTSMVTWGSSAPSVATVSASGLVASVAPGSTAVTATLGSASGSDAITVPMPSPPPPPPPPSPAAVNVTTFHFDNKRSGLNNSESVLSPANVKPATFGKLFSLTVDGYVYAQPLYMSGLTVNGAKHNILLVSTEKNNVYAFDADSYNNNQPLWQTSLLKNGETPAAGGNPNPYHGSTSTPVIDANTDTMYVVTQQIGSGESTFRLNAIDITTGNVLKTATITAQVSPAKNSDSVNGVLTLSQGLLQRTALLLDNGTLYFGFSADDSGWLLAYDEATLSQKGAFAVGPNNDGNGEYLGDGGIWMGGDGPVADGAGGIYVSTGNGPYNDVSNAYGDSLLHLDSTLNLKDWFTPQDFGAMQCSDQDLSGGGVIMLPNGDLVAGGKSGKVFQVASGNLGQGPHNEDSGAVTTLFPGDKVGLLSYSFTCTASDTTNPPNGQPYPTGTWNGTKTPYQLFGTPAYYNNSVYVGMTPGPVVQLAMDSSGKLTLTNNSTKETVATGSLGTTPVISANNNTNAVLWFVDHGTPLQSGTPTSAILRAYDPTDLSKELYDSKMNAADNAGFGVKFSAPVVVNGKVFVATANDANLATNSKGEIDVYGLK